MTSNGQFSDRHNIPVPGDGQDEPADDSTQARNVSDASQENWGDLLQTALLSDDFIDGKLVDSGTLSGRPNAGTSAPKYYVITDAGDSGDQLILTYNDDSVWHRVQDLERVAIAAADSPYSASDGESLWVDASGGAVTVSLPSPTDGLVLRVVVTDATNDVTISRNGTESIDGSASDLSLVVEGVLTLESDGTSWRRTEVEAQHLAATGLKSASGQLNIEPAGFAGAFLSDDGADNLQANLGEGLEGDGADNIKVKEPFAYDPGMTEFEDGLSNEEIDRLVLQTGETLIVERIEFRQKGGGSSTSASIDVRDTTALTTVGSQTLGGTTKDPGSSGSGNTVIIRASNSTGATVNGAPRVHGYIEGA